MKSRMLDKGQKKRKGKKSKKPDEPSPKPSKHKYRGVIPPPFNFRPTAISLNDLYKELVKSKKICIGDEIPHPTAIYIQKTSFDYDLHPSYDVFLKFLGQGKKNWVSFSLDALRKDPDQKERDQITLRERSMIWDDNLENGFEEKEIWGFYYHTIEGMGKKELAKRRKSVKKQARTLLFEEVIDTAWRILNKYCDGYRIKLVYQEYPSGIERLYLDAKSALWAIERSLENKEIQEKALEKRVV